MKLPIRPAALLFVSILCAGALSACGKGSTPGNCTAPSGQAVLVYPAPGSTGIPDNFPGIVFGSTNGLASSYDAIIQQAGTKLQVPQRRVAPAPVPLPSPYLTPAFPNPVYQISGAFKSLQGGSKYLVYLNDADSACNPTFVGSFTSQ